MAKLFGAACLKIRDIQPFILFASYAAKSPNRLRFIRNDLGIFPRAERKQCATRLVQLIKEGPLETRCGEDLYQQIFDCLLSDEWDKVEEMTTLDIILKDLA